jgi:hypothetical protein
MSKGSHMAVANHPLPVTLWMTTARRRTLRLALPVPGVVALFLKNEGASQFGLPDDV